MVSADFFDNHLVCLLAWFLVYNPHWFLVSSLLLWLVVFWGVFHRGHWVSSPTVAFCCRRSRSTSHWFWCKHNPRSTSITIHCLAVACHRFLVGWSFMVLLSDDGEDDDDQHSCYRWIKGSHQSQFLNFGPAPVDSRTHLPSCFLTSANNIDPIRRIFKGESRGMYWYGSYPFQMIANDSKWQICGSWMGSKGTRD